MGTGRGGHRACSAADPHHRSLRSPWAAGGVPGGASVLHSSSLACAGGRPLPTAVSMDCTPSRDSTCEALPLHDCWMASLLMGPRLTQWPVLLGGRPYVASRSGSPRSHQAGDRPLPFETQEVSRGRQQAGLTEGRSCWRGGWQGAGWCLGGQPHAVWNLTLCPGRRDRPCRCGLHSFRSPPSRYGVLPTVGCY